MNDHVNFYDIGYRFIRRFWGKAAINYAFNTMKLESVYALQKLEIRHFIRPC